MDWRENPWFSNGSMHFGVPQGNDSLITYLILLYHHYVPWCSPQMVIHGNIQQPTI